MANNPYVNKVQKADGTTLIDLTSDTAVASDVASGKYFHLATGERVAGTASGGGGGLPSGYTRVSYIEADGNQYALTDITPDANTKVKCVFCLTDIPATGTLVYVYGNTEFYFGPYGPSMFNASGNNFASITPDGDIHVATRIGNSFSLTDPILPTATINISSPSYPEKKLALFCRNGSSFDGYCSARMFSFQAWDNTTLIADMVPVVKTNNNTAGLYDLVSGMFYASETNTPFIAGDEYTPPTSVSELTVKANGTYTAPSGYAFSPVNIAVAGGITLPSGYVQLQYVYSSGSQYVDTGFVPTGNTRVECDFALTSVDNTNRAIFGTAGQFAFRKYSSTIFRTNGGNNADFSLAPDTNKHRVIKVMTGAILDGECKVNTTATVSLTLAIFAYHSASTTYNANSLVRIYTFKIWESGTLVRDFIPAKNSSNVVGLYDIVNDVWYKSGTTTALVAGPAV